MSEGLSKLINDACNTGDLDGLLSVLYNYPDVAIDIIKGKLEDGSPSPFLHTSCKNGHLSIVRQLIEAGADVNMLSSNFHSPLSMACENGHLRVAKHLIEKGATINAFDPDFEKSPVFLACCKGHTDVLEHLISKEPGIIQRSGQFLLYIAVYEGHLDIVKLLVQRRVNVNPPTTPVEEDDQPTQLGALYAACDGKQVGAAKYLIENGALVTRQIVEAFGEDVVKEVLFRYTKDAKVKRKTALSFEHDPEVTMFSAPWGRKNLYLLHKSWFVDYSLRLVNIDLAYNCLDELPEEILNTLPALEELDVSNNNLVCLPEITNLSYMRLEKLFAQRNQLTLVPSSLFHLKTLKKVNLSYNKLTFIGEDPDGAESADVEPWRCTSLKILKLNHNSIQSLPSGIQSASGLIKLFVSNNKLKDFPMPWKCPLETLDLSYNCLATFTCSVDMEWANTLIYLNLSNNTLEAISGNICQLTFLQDLDASHNRIRSMPPEHYWRCKNMHKLNLSFNKLSSKIQGDSTTNTLRQRFFKQPVQEDGQDPKTDCELPVEFFGPTLETLLLNDNSLHVVPPSICKLTNLNELDLSNNPDLKTLPPELGNLRNCWQLRLNKLTLIDLPKHVRPGTMGVRPKDTLAYLRATLRKSVPYYRMKLMVVGIQGYGKTTLLAALKGQPLPGNLSTVGIVVNEWSVQISNSSLLSRIISPSTGPPTVTFSTWDLAGQSVYYAAHQMFLSPSTLYLAIWNVTLGDEGIENLRNWLLNIKARAPYSDVIVIGTHLDQLPKQNRESRVEKLKLSIMHKYVDSKGYPKIVGNTVVSATTGEGITELREMIYKKALNCKEQGEKIIGKQVPLSYIQLQDALMQEAERRRVEREPPVLVEDEILALAEKNKDNDIHDHEELALATRFLHENGVLLHYNDQLRGLKTLYFIDPTWVCDLIASIVTVREKNGYVRDGIMLTRNVQLVLRDPRFPPQFIPQYLQLMERFEIALALDVSQLLIPSMLPRESPGMKLNKLYKLSMPQKPRSKTTMTLPSTARGKGIDMAVVKRKSATLTGSENWHPSLDDEKSGDSDEEDGGKELPDPDSMDECHDVTRRNYQMAYIPSGLWSRLITRLMVSLQRWRQTEGIDEDRFSMIYWRKGIGVMYEGGHFLVESYRELVPLSMGRSRYEELEGISVEVWSHTRDFSVMGFIVDQIDALISEWYPGLDDTDSFGFPLVRRLIPCPRCTSSIKKRNSVLRRSTSMEYPSTHGTQPSRPYNFTLPTCAATALSFATIQCPYHPDSVVSLDELIPDLLMTDLPRNLLVDRSDFAYRTDVANRLGSGGAGEVFRGVLRKEFVAVKTFHSTRTSGILLDSGLGGTGFNNEWSASGMRSHSEGLSMRRAGLHRSEGMDEDNLEDELEKTKVVRAFWDLRQEVAVLCHLEHPCVVRLLGVCLHPLCFLLELAPQGSLATVLEDLAMGTEAKEGDPNRPVSYGNRQSALGRGLTYKIAYQVASALWYLHDSDIIYRDLKADNVLVWSLDDTDLVNIKLSDYGISCFATPQGVAGDEGTPGYQAPEVRAGVGYDEKVDIFSYAIFLFELISGTRPFRNYRSAVDIKRDIRRNIRPSLEDLEIDSQLPRLEQLMRWSWRDLPERRPSADNIMREMEEPGFLCQCRIMPAPEKGEVLEKITAIFGLTQSTPGNPQSALSSSLAATPSSTVLLWSRERGRRNYSWLNCDTGEFQGQEEPCPGHRVLCMVQVGKRIWLGTEGCTIEVFGRRSWQLPSTLCSFIVKAPVLALLTEESSGGPQEGASESSFKQASAFTDIPAKTNSRVVKVYASLANGTVIVFTHSSASSACQSHDDVIARYTDDTDDVIKAEMTQWRDTQVINLGQSSNPAKSMVLVKSARELWVGCGNKIVVMDTQTLAVVDEIAVYSSQRAHIRKMVVCGDKVWSIDRRSTKILEWDVNTHQLTLVFDLEVKDPIGKVVCNLFSQSSGQDIGEDEASIPGNTIPRWKGTRPRVSDHVFSTPPSYAEATDVHSSSSPKSPGAKVLVDRALGGGGLLNRSGAVKKRSLERATAPQVHPPQDENLDNQEERAFEFELNSEDLPAGEIHNKSADVEPPSSTHKETIAGRGGTSDETWRDLVGTSVDSGFVAEDELQEQPLDVETKIEEEVESVEKQERRLLPSEKQNDGQNKDEDDFEETVETGEELRESENNYGRSIESKFEENELLEEKTVIDSLNNDKDVAPVGEVREKNSNESVKEEKDSEVTGIKERETEDVDGEEKPSKDSKEMTKEAGKGSDIEAKDAVHGGEFRGEEVIDEKLSKDSKEMIKEAGEGSDIAGKDAALGAELQKKEVADDKSSKDSREMTKEAGKGSDIEAKDAPLGGELREEEFVDDELSKNSNENVKDVKRIEITGNELSAAKVDSDGKDVDSETGGESTQTDEESENGAETPTFELVNRKEIIVGQAKEREQSKRSALFYDKETASMESLSRKPRTIQRGPSLMRSWKKSRRQPAPPIDDAVSRRRHAQRPRLHVMTGSINKVMTIEMIGGTLWVGRGRGDIVIVNVDPEAESCQYGEVLTRMEFENHLNYDNGQIDEIINTGNNKVVCSRRLEPVRMRKAASQEKMHSPQSPTDNDPSTERYQLIVLEAWGRREFQGFKSHLDRFNALMD